MWEDDYLHMLSDAKTNNTESDTSKNEDSTQLNKQVHQSTSIKISTTAGTGGNNLSTVPESDMEKASREIDDDRVVNSDAVKLAVEEMQKTAEEAITNERKVFRSAIAEKDGKITLLESEFESLTRQRDNILVCSISFYLSIL
jgi:hypothetical protein